MCSDSHTLSERTPRAGRFHGLPERILGGDADMIFPNKSPVDDMGNIKSIGAVWKMGIDVKPR